MCDRLYQLTTDTPVLLANSGIFMFTDCSVEMHGSFVGIVLSSELPVACRELFKDLLSQLADLRFQVCSLNVRNSCSHWVSEFVCNFIFYVAKNDHYSILCDRHVTEQIQHFIVLHTICVTFIL